MHPYLNIARTADGISSYTPFAIFSDAWRLFTPGDASCLGCSSVLSRLVRDGHDVHYGFGSGLKEERRIVECLVERASREKKTI